MTETTKAIFESFEVRKSRKQKDAFIDWVTPVAEAQGYEVSIDKGALGVKNIVIGSPKDAKVVFTAHYDTCAALPFPNFITPKSVLIFMLYQLLIVVGIMALGIAVEVLFILLNVPYAHLALSAVMLTACALILVGPANKHTANDNTSGVTAVIDIMRVMPEELRGKAAFILFDLEEAGLLGSSHYRSAHKSEIKDKLMVNFDCVSDGKNILFVVKKGARPFAPALRAAFPSEGEFVVEVAEKGAIYPSDQASFPRGVGVASLKRSKFLGLLYMDRIHTKRDTVYESENIEYLTRGAVRLTEALSRGEMSAGKA